MALGGDHVEGIRGGGGAPRRRGDLQGFQGGLFEYSAARSPAGGGNMSVQAFDETSMRVGAYVPPAGERDGGGPAPAPDPRLDGQRLSPITRSASGVPPPAASPQL